MLINLDLLQQVSVFTQTNNNVKVTNDALPRKVRNLNQLAYFMQNIFRETRNNDNNVQ